MSHYLQYYKDKYNRETIVFEFKCSDTKHLNIKVFSVIVEVELIKSISDNIDTIQIISLSKISNTNLREFISKIYGKYLLLFNSTKAEKLPTCAIFKNKIKLTNEFKKESI